MQDRIEVYLTEQFLFEFGEELNADSDLFKAGIIDSMGYIQLIKFLESEFSIRLTEEELLSNVLVSVNGMVEFVQSKLETSASA